RGLCWRASSGSGRVVCERRRPAGRGSGQRMASASRTAQHRRRDGAVDRVPGRHHVQREPERQRVPGACGAAGPVPVPVVLRARPAFRRGNRVAGLARADPAGL
ncbi:hypothetical protein H4R19_005714, partial [Coemansia spiralis]